MTTPKILPVIHHLNAPLSKAQADLAIDAGADGFFLISHTGTSLPLAEVARALRIRFGSQVDIGINMLGWPPMMALGAAIGCGANMLWMDDSIVSSRCITPEGAALLSKSQALGDPSLKLFASVAFKYQQYEPEPALAAHLARANGMTPTTSGATTGMAPPLEKIKAMHVPGKELAIASGMTPANVASFAPYLSHILVATGVSEDENHFDFELLSAFVGAVHSAGEAST